MIVAIIGSTKYQKGMETLKCNLAVLGIAVYVPTKFYREVTKEEEDMLKGAYKIALSSCDLAVALCADNYIGNGTMEELNYCSSKHIPNVIASDIDDAVNKVKEYMGE
jgi:hypothetical protein